VTTVYLAASGDENDLSLQNLGQRPAVLVSYPQLSKWESTKTSGAFPHRSWALDSGAFMAWSRGAVISLENYIRDCARLQKTSSPPEKIFSLDVIGGPQAGVSLEAAAKQSLHNCEAMCRSGISAIPTFHFGEPEEFLRHILARYDSIALGGLFRVHKTRRTAWLHRCFELAWPRKIHGFALTSKPLLDRFPFHSVDSSNWRRGPHAWGLWCSFNFEVLRVPDKKISLRGEAEFYLRMERQLKDRWRKEMFMLEKIARKHELEAAP